MYGSARSSSSPPPASPARVTDALAGLVVDDDPRAAIAGLIRATPKRTRTSSAGSDDSNTALASPAASSAAAAAADVIARARAAAAGDDAVWRTAKAAVDAVAAATRPATFETKRKDSLGAGDAAHVVARAASARAEHAAEVAAAAAAHAAAAAAFARASPGAFADEEASAAARLADDAAEVATRAAADATAAAARAEQTSLRAASLRLAQLQGASVFANDGSLGGSGVLPPTPPAVKRRESANEKKMCSDAETTSNTFDGDGVGASGTFRLAENVSEPRGKLESPEPKGLRSDLFDFDSNANETRASPAPARAPGSLGKPRRVRISEHDALLFDAAEAKLALREGRRRAAAALAEAGKAEAKGAVARALASAGAAPARSDHSRLPQGHGIVASRRAVDAMDRAAARLMDRRDRNEEAPDETSASRSAGSDDFCVSETNVAANEDDGETKRRMKRRYDPGSFEVSLVNAHTRFHGEMNQTDKRLFEEDLRSARAATRAAAAAAAAGGVGGGGASDVSSRRVGPRPTKKSQAAAAAAAERKRRAAEERAARLREAEAVVGSFAPFKASPAPSPAKPARFPAVRDSRKSASPASQSPSFVRAGTNAASPSRSSPTSAFARGSPRSRESPLSVAKEKGEKPSDRLVAARALLADLKTGVPVGLADLAGAPKERSTWHELKEAGRRSVARVRAYQSAEGSPPGATPAHERYQHYKMMGFGGMGAKTSWAR